MPQLFKILPKPKPKTTIVTAMPKTIVMSKPVRFDINVYKRERYRTDSVYAETVRERNRQARRAKKNARKVELDYDRAVERVDDTLVLASVCKNNGSVIELPVITQRGLSKVVKRDYHTILRWINRGLIPNPILVGADASVRDRAVYHRDEAVAIIGELSRHFLTYGTYGEDHKTAIARMRAAVQGVREKLKL